MTTASEGHEAGAEPRRKRCGSCRDFLPWDATYCHHCGAGKPEAPPEREPEPEPEPARRVVPWGLLLAGLAIAAVLVGGVIVWQKAKESEAAQEAADKRARIRLGNRKVELRQQIETVSARHAQVLAKAEKWIEVARIQRRAQLEEEEAASKDKAAALFEQADQLDTQLAALRDELRAVEAELAKLGVQP